MRIMMITTNFISFLRTFLVLILLFVKMYGVHSKFSGNGGKCREREKTALLKFKAELIDEYGRLSSWGGFTNCCEWKGVVCDNRTNHVVALDLHGNYALPLEGKISPSLLQLPHLQYLDLSFNDFNGTTIPYFIGLLSKLQHLNLSYSNFGGSIPHHIGNLSALRLLDLGYNSELTVTNLDWLSGIQSLEYLDLSTANLETCTTWLQPIHKLTALKQLHLFACDLPTVVEPPISIPSLNSSNSLVVLDLSVNNFRSSSVILRFLNMSTSFTYIDFSRNDLEGRVPDALGNLMSLFHLDLSHNKFTGSLQGNWRLPKLDYLDLSNNKFTGILPNLSSCPSLRVLNLFDNTFNVILKESIGNLSKIEYLLVGNNKLEGMITEAHLSRLPQLTTLDLSFNLNITISINPSWMHPVQFFWLDLTNCKLGPHFPNWLKKQNQLEFLDISNSGIFDTIPGWFWGNMYTCRYLNLSHNHIFGALPNLSSKFEKLRTIDLSYNEFTGSLPHLPPILFNIDFSTNKFSGTLNNFCYFSGLEPVLDLSNNLLSGDIPQDCFMNLLSLPYLNLANNNFSGEIPTTNSTCRVSLLHLRNNSFRGEIPRSLMSCSELRILDLGENEFNGEIPRWLGESMPKLGVLILKSNMLYGSLPSSICHLANIQVLDISLNKITELPNCVNNFTLLSSEICSDYWNNLFTASRNDSYFYDSASVIWKGKEETYFNTLGLLKMIDLSGNELAGEIPRELMSLIGLLGLNLSRNNLAGLIPDDIDKLKLLNFLDLSRNKLSGGVPPTLSKLGHLGVLDLSFNNLSGRIPWDTHMQTFGASTYLGNPRLCGPPLLRRPCPEDEKPSSGKDDSEDEDKLITRGFYISAVVGFVIAFWVVFWTLFFNKWWNVIAIKIYTTVADWLYVQILINKRRLLGYLSNA